MILTNRTCCAAMVLLGALGVGAASAVRAADSSPFAGCFAATGRIVLIRPAAGGASRYALEQPGGRVTHHLSPASPAKVSAYLGREVGVDGPMLLVEQDDALVVRAEQITPLDGAGEVATVGYEAPIAPDMYDAGRSAPLYEVATFPWLGGRSTCAPPPGSCGAPGYFDPGMPPPQPPLVNTTPAVPPSPRDLAFLQETTRYGNRYWVLHDYLGWWVEGDRVPPLVTTATPGTPALQAGRLGQPTTGILFGDQRVDTGFRSGARITVGGWVTPFTTGIEGQYYSFLRERTDYAVSSYFSQSPNGPILARPFFNVVTGLQDARLVAFPDILLNTDLDGRLHVHANSDVQSASATLKQLITLWYPPDYRIYLIGGYRFFRLDEGLRIQGVVMPVGPGVPAGTSFTGVDNFATSNQFHGGDVGLSGEWHLGRWSLSGATKVALGNMNETVMIDGSRTSFDGTTTTTAVGNLLAQPTNIGRFTQNQFALIPEVDLKIGYQITPRLRATFGYNFTYVTRVVRPGSEIDLGLNPTQFFGGMLVGAPRPAPQFNPTSVWLQGITAGVEARF